MSEPDLRYEVWKARVEECRRAGSHRYGPEYNLCVECGMPREEDYWEQEMIRTRGLRRSTQEPPQSDRQSP